MPIKTLTTIAASAPNISVSSNASPNTLGNFANLGTTTEQWDAIQLLIRTNANADRYFLLQLYTNDSGSDTALGDPIPLRLQSNAKLTTFFAFVRIPSGTAIKAKCMDTAGSGSLLLTLQGVTSGANVRQGAATGPNCWKFIGSNNTTASSIFTTCDNGGTANSFLSFTLGTTGADFNAMGLITRTAVGVNGDGQIRILDDGAVVWGNTYVRMVNGDHFQVQYGAFPLDAVVANGSVITAEFSCTSTTAGSRQTEAAVYFQNLPALGGSSTTIIQGSGMQRLLKDGETNAALKSIALHVVTSAAAHYNANGETPRIKIGAGAWGDAAGAVVGTADSNEYILSDTEAGSANPGELILVYLPATVNHLRSPIAAYEVGTIDPSSAVVDAQVKGMDSAVITAVQSGLATSAGLAPLATASAVSTLDGKVDAVAAYVDTEVAAIKAKTDNLPAAPAAVSDIPSTTSIRNAILTWELWSGMNLARFLRALGVLFRGKSSGQNSLAPSFENDDGSIVLSATIDAQNNRTSVTDNASGTP